MIEAYFDGSEKEFEAARLQTGRTFPLDFDRIYNAGIHDTEQLPLYFQYQGHSLTIVGLECLDNGSRNVLVLDPGGVALPQTLLTNLDLHLVDQAGINKAMALFRFPESALCKKKAYQILQVVGAYDGVEDPEGRKLRRTFVSAATPKSSSSLSIGMIPADGIGREVIPVAFPFRLSPFDDSPFAPFTSWLHLNAFSLHPLSFRKQAAQRVIEAVMPSSVRLSFVPLNAGFELFQKTGIALPEETVRTCLDGGVDGAMFGS
ncbi:hypothetical protein BC830DRAFT_1176077, partial [Chytriomyces sp. MP71]